MRDLSQAREAGRYSGAYRGGECWAIIPAWAGLPSRFSPTSGRPSHALGDALERRQRPSIFRIWQAFRKS